MNLTVVGAGNSGLIHAAKLIERGFKVGILKTSRKANDEFPKGRYPRRARNLTRHRRGYA